MPTKAGPQPDSGYSYVRTEIIALQWIRAGVTESQKFQWVSSQDSAQLHKTVELYAVANNVSDDYDCAVSLLAPYKDSKNESVRNSVDSLLLAIKSAKEINAVLIGMMEALNKATKPEDINQAEIAKTLADLKSMQKYVHGLTMAGVKMSTFSILRMEGTGDDVKPTAFTITATQRDTLLVETREFAKKKGKEETYLDLCTEILLTTLTLKLPMSPGGTG
jgi:hypothetical protein